MTDLITRDLVVLDADLGAERRDVIHALAELVVAAGRATEADSLFADAWERESKGDTGVPGGIAIPHCRSAAVTAPALVMARLKPPVDFGAFDGPADIVFMIAAPEGAHSEHLQLLAKLARSLMLPEFLEELRSAATPDDVVRIVSRALADEEEPAAAPAGAASSAATGAVASASAATSDAPLLVAVTACPTGIAHTYMAADALVAAAKRAGAELKVETQGSAGATPLPPDVIERADAVIFAVDVDVRDQARFAGKPVVRGPVKRGVDRPDEMVAEALTASKDPNARRVPGGDAAAATSAAGAERNEHFGLKLKRWLLTGVSYMIPFVAGGGLLIALGFLLGGYRITDVAGDVILNNSLWNLPAGGLGEYLGAVAFSIGAASMGFLVPALAGYIAYAIADRPGIAPGFVAGAVALLMNAGFLGGLVGGLLAGWAAWLIGRPAVPRWLRGLMPVVIIPLGASIVASGLLLVLLGAPIAALMAALNGWLSSMTGTGAILVGIILGAMMAFDLGGPVNKVAYSFAVAGLSAGSLDNQVPWQIMAAVMAAGMVPPLAMALATVLDRKGFSVAEHENGKAAWLLGAAFISEGAIPFAAADPLRVLPAGIVGSALTGALVMSTGVTSQAPHGGIFVWFAIGNFPLFALWIAAGAVVSALLVVALKRWVRRRPQVAAEETVPAPAAVPAAV